MRLFRQPQLSPAVFMGDSLWTGSGTYRRSRVEYGISGYIAFADCTYGSFDHQSPQVEGRESCGRGNKGWETAHLQGNYFHSGGKGNHALFLLLLRCRTDNDALGKQLSESCKRNRRQNSCFLCRNILEQNVRSPFA